MISNPGNIFPPFDPTTTFTLYDDFPGGVLIGANGNFVSQNAWKFNTFTQNPQFPVVAGAPGVIRCAVDGISLQQIIHLWDNIDTTSPRMIANGSQGNMTFLGRSRATISADQTNLLGLFAGAENAAAQGIYFYVAGAGTWHTVTRDGAGVSDQDTGVAQDAVNFKTFKFVTNAAGTSISFYINNVLVTTHNTRIPAIPLGIGFGAQMAVGGGNLDMDYIFLKITGLSR
jgi:hypothetical protein